ncbi:putative transcription factor interactor and regulator CCHC(Zn) family [Helianthus annuus]|nr:putative transcription factor interactor and regulator CCHC(Zn) family [Helianthus annuus]
MTTITAFTIQERTSHQSHKFSFTLNPNNYGHWKALIEPFLKANSLYRYVDNSLSCPNEKLTTTDATTTNPNYTAWVANDAHVRMLIISTVSEPSFQHVQGATARDVWLSLERAYAPSTASHEFTLKTQLLKISMKGDEKPFDYLSRAQEYATALANIGEPMKDKDLVMLTIAGLREEYLGLKSNLLARSPPVQFNELHGLLSDHDYIIRSTTNLTPSSAAPQVFTVTAATNSAPINPTMESIQQQLNNLQLLASQLSLQQQTTAPQPAPQANFAARSNFSRNNRGNGRNYRGRGNRGRGGSPIQGSRQFAWASTQNTVYGHCNRCGIGHIPSQCPNQSGSSHSSPQANYAHSEAGSYTTWNPDTGANSHGTPDLASMDNSEAYYGRGYQGYPPYRPQ